MAERKKPTSFSDTNAAGRRYKKSRKRGSLARPLEPGDPGYERSRTSSSRRRESDEEKPRRKEERPRKEREPDLPIGAGMAERARQAQIADRARRQSKLDEIMRSISRTDRKTMEPTSQAGGGKSKRRK